MCCQPDMPVNCETLPITCSVALMAARRVEDTLSEQWIRNNTKPCPRCNVAIFKVAGCNHMTCSSCNSHFCWVCNAGPYRTAKDTYIHLNEIHGGYYDAEELARLRLAQERSAARQAQQQQQQQLEDPGCSCSIQ
jgi:hypothetical protein